MNSHYKPRSVHALAFALIAVAVLGVFGRTVAFPYNAFDDREYLLGNEIVSKGITAEGLRYAFTNTVVSHWNPVTVLSHMVMVQAFGLAPGPQHAANVAIHFLSAALVYWVLFRMTGAPWPSLLAALIFAVHPLRAESVAWIAERKGLLSGFFGLLTVSAYVEYARKPGVWRYLLVALAFALSLMGKAALLSLPVALLVLDYWSLGRVPGEKGRWSREGLRLIAEKIPLLALALGSAVITLEVTSRQHVVGSSEAFPFIVRLGNAARSSFMYLANTVVPMDLAPQYPHPGRGVFGPALCGEIALLVAITVLAIVYRKRAPWFFTGWFWYLLVLAPLSGVVQVANQGRADRYTYIPQIGLCVIAAWGVDAFCRRISQARWPVVGVAVAGVVAFGTAGFHQTSFWRDNYTLFLRGVAVNPESGMVHYGLGVAQLERGEMDTAEQSFQNAIVREPPIPEAFSNLGAFEMRRGNFAQAAAYFSRALEIDPANPALMVNLGTAYFKQGQAAEAARLVETALARQPGDPRALALKAATQAPPSKP